MRRLLAATLALASLVTGAHAQQFDSCGTLEAGVTCPLLFRADSTSELYILDAPLGSLGVGDRIRVLGQLDTGCFSICGQGDGCIFGTIVQNCLPATIGTPYCNGFPNSTGAIGAMGAIGSTSIADNDVTLFADGLPASAATLFLCSRIQDLVPNPAGSQGTLCLGSPIGRFQSQVTLSDAGGSALISTDPVFGAQSFSLGALPQPTGSVPALAGETWNFQAWHRDFVGGSVTSNFTEALSITFS